MSMKIAMDKYEEEKVPAKGKTRQHKELLEFHAA